MSVVDPRGHLWVISRTSDESSALVRSLHERGAGVEVLEFPGTEGAQLPTGAGLSGIALSLGAALREAWEGVDISGLEQRILSAQPAPDAVLYLEADVALRVQSVVRARLGAAPQLAIEPHLSIDPRWTELGVSVQSARDGGGALTGIGDTGRALGDERPFLVVATHDLAASWVDPLLLQLSIAQLDDHALLFLPSGDRAVDDQLKSRADFYGLVGQRPALGGDLDGWIRGARALVGRPSERQLVAALSSGVAAVLVGEWREGSGGAWAIAHDHAQWSRAPVEVSLAVEQSLSSGSSGPIEVGGPEEAAGRALSWVQSRSSDPPGTGPTDGAEELETIGRSTDDAPQSSPEHERLEIDDALADLKRRMGLNDVEG